MDDRGGVSGDSGSLTCMTRAGHDYVSFGLEPNVTIVPDQARGGTRSWASGREQCMLLASRLSPCGKDRKLRYVKTGCDDQEVVG